jgi:hypothetical protein
MTSHNDITGDALRTKGSTDSYRDGWDRIFGKKAKEPEPAPQAPATEELTYVARRSRSVPDATSIDDALGVINEVGAAQRVSGNNVLFKATPINAMAIKGSLHGWKVEPEQKYKLPDARHHVRLYDEPQDDLHD